MKHIFLCHDPQGQIAKHQFELEQAGYEVRLFRNGGDLVRALAKETPDLVMLDVMLDGKNGFAVCAGMDLITTRRFPVVLVGGIYRRPAFRQEAQRLGVSEFVDGTFDDMDLLGTVARVLETFEEGSDQQAA